MKLNRLFSTIAGIALAAGLTGCDEKEFVVIEGNLPIKSETLYMVGDATPKGWDIGNPTPLQASEADALVFSWEGTLYAGEMKLCLTPGSWDAPFIRPEVNGTEIGKTDIVDAKFAMHAGDPDDKWVVAAAGKYRLTFDLRNWTMSTAFLGEPDAPSKDPIATEVMYMVGDATPAGWSIDAPTPLEKVSPYIFKYEGTLLAGEMKGCIETGDWNVQFIRPATADCKINKSGVESPDFVFTAAPDDKWKIEEAGQYRLTFDLENYTLTAEYLGEVPAQTKEPIEAENVYMVGDATSAGWDIEAPTALTKQSQYIFVYEGELVPGEMKACTQAGSWDAPFIRPTTADCQISLSGVADNNFQYTAGNPDNKWKITEAGKYRITFDLEHYTIQVEAVGTVAPLEAENVYIVGDATPVGWNIDAPQQLTKQSQYVFVYEGALNTGEVKACIQTGDWMAPFIRPTSAAVKINKNGVESSAFQFSAGDPDYKWNVEEAGNYRLTFDLEHWTIKAEAME